MCGAELAARAAGWHPGHGPCYSRTSAFWSHAGTAGVTNHDVGGTAVLTGRLSCGIAVGALLALALAPGGAHAAAVSPFWQELGGSASGDGVSQTPAPKAVFDTSTAVGADGLPVVVYAEFADGTATQGAITVKGWNGSAWVTLSGPAGIAQGYQPQVRIGGDGSLHVAWLQDDVDGNTEIHLRTRAPAGTTFDELAGSDSPGGIVGANTSVLAPFSLALDAGNHPVVALLALATTGIVDVTDTPALIDGTSQVYVRRFNGSAWEFLGSDFITGSVTNGGGASNAQSFSTGGSSFLHGADAPSLTVDHSGAPVVAFVYFTTQDGGSVANTDLYVATWDGAAWTAVGPAVPSSATSDGVGGPGGVSNSPDGSFNPSLAADGTGKLALAWEEEPNGGGAVYVWVREWSASAWNELGGSASGSGFTEPGTLNVFPQVAYDLTSQPLVAWQAMLSNDVASQIFVRRWNGTDTWEEPAFHSSTGSGISDAALDAFGPALAVTPPGGPATAGVPTIAWLDDRNPGSAQVFLRQFFAGAAFPLTVTVAGAGEVASDPIGLDCAAGACTASFPSGTQVTLTPTATPPAMFLGWAGDCTGTGGCNVEMTVPHGVNASFSVVLEVTVAAPGGGGVSSVPAGLTSCVDSCNAEFAPGTTVTLTATADAGGAFAGWGGACAFRGTNLTCQVKLAALNTQVTASFKHFSVRAAVATPAGTFGQGAVGNVSGGGIDCSLGGAGTCVIDVPQGTRVVLQATPQPGNRFLSWSGGPCGGRTNATCEMVVTANSSSTALFRGVTGVRVLKAGNGTGTVSSPGLACGTDCFEEIFTGTSVTLTPSPATGTIFRGWAGDVCDGQASGNCVFTASGANRSVTVLNQSVTATFTLVKQKLTVATVGDGFVAADLGGIDCGTGGHPQCMAEYDYGSVVTLTPFPDPDRRLAMWTGCTRLNGSACVAVLTANSSVKGTFGIARTLFVSASGNGTGQITAGTTPPLVCVSNCSVSQLVAGNTSVTLTPKPAVGTTFHWLQPPGDICTGSGACTTVMSLNRSAVGDFTLNRHSLAVVQRLNGSVASNLLPGGVTLDCGTSGSVCGGIFDYGTPVTLQATANTGFTFTGWTGVMCSGGAANRTCAFVLQGNTTVTPAYRPRTQVTILKTGNGSGTVTGPGLSCGTDCTEPEFDAKLVTLTAAPATGSHVGGFAGACVSNTSTCKFVPAGDSQNVSVTFTLNRHLLRVVSRPNGNVATLESLPDTIDCGAGGLDCLATLDYGTMVTLQATPIPGTRFVSWTGVSCLRGGATNASCAFVLRGNTTATPTYRDITSVTLTKTGQGTVTSTPAGISCGLACTTAAFDFARGVVVKLTPAPATGWDFISWSGDPTCPGTAPCSFNASPIGVAVAANFSIQLKTLRATVVGNGSVTGPGYACNQDTTPCAQIFTYGTVEPLTPAAAPGFRFTGWTQDCSGTAACKPTMTANHSVTATFKQVFGVTVARQGNSAATTGTITATGISCGPGAATNCSEDYLSGTSVTFSRSAPPAGRTFQWLGDCGFRNTNASCTLLIDANKSILADYSLQPLGLTVSVSGPGSAVGLVGTAATCATVNCLVIVDYGTAVTLQAVSSPSPAGEFFGWTGCTAVVGTNCSFTLTANRTVVAAFQPAVSSLAVTALATDTSVPLAKGAIRQYSAVATFSDGSTQDVTARSAWVSGNTSVVTVGAATGLATGVGVGNTSLTATFKTKPLLPAGGSTAIGALAVGADTLTATSVIVACAPYGDASGLNSRLACLPAGVGYEVECRATATFTNAGPQDVTDQAMWTSTNVAFARPLGLSEFNGPVTASFRIFAGIAAIKATVGGIVSPTPLPLSPGNNSWTVQGVALTAASVPNGANVSVATPLGPVNVGTPVQLQAIASFNPAAGCASPPPRDFSLLTSWDTMPHPSPVATVNFFGLVEPVAAGPVTIHWAYPPSGHSGDVPISVLP